MQAVTQPVAEGCALRSGDGDRAHDLANLALPAEQVAAGPHPGPDVASVAMELERTGVDRRPLRPRNRRLGGDDVEDVHPPRRAVDDLEAAVASDRDVVLDDRRDVDAEVVEGAHRGRWYRRASPPAALSPARGPEGARRWRRDTLGRLPGPHRLEAQDATLSR